MEPLNELNPSSPNEKRSWEVDNLSEMNGFRFSSVIVPGIVRVVNEYKPLPGDVILASYPKTGTTWLKSLLFSIIYRSSKDSLLNHHPHELVPFLENQAIGRTEPSPNIATRRLSATHIPYQLLRKTLDSSNCRVVYIARNPKDTVISYWHFINKMKDVKDGRWSLEESVERFCSGRIHGGLYYDHVMGFKKASLEKPENIFFITYEELMADTKTHVNRMAEFLGCSFDKEDEVEEIVKSCSFDSLSNLEVNKSGDTPPCFPAPNNSYFRRGVIGDHMNYLDTKAIERIDELTRENFHASGFMYEI